MKRKYLIGLLLVLCLRVGAAAENLPVHSMEGSFSHTMVISDFDSTVAGGEDWKHGDSVILGPVYLNPLANGWRRSFYVNLDSIFAGDTLRLIFQTSPQKHLTARALTTNRILGWTMVDSSVVIPVADTVLNFSPFLLDSLVTTGWNQAVWARVIVRHRWNNGFTGAGAGTPTVPAAADSALVGNQYQWRYQYFMIPIIGGSRNTY